MTRVALFTTCLVDQLYPEVGVATVRVLRKAGCEVSYDPAQTCCGQPAFNSGFKQDGLAVARRFVDLYDPAEYDAIVVPSGSCTAMIRHLPRWFDDSSYQERARSVAARTHELSSFLVNELGCEDLGARFDGRVTWHDACHGLRDLGIKDEPRRLIQNVAGAELVEMEPGESCCGFGGTFSVKYPEVSVAILDRKLETLQKVDAIVSGDVSCLMQIGGRLSRLRSPIRTLHLAELLAADGARP
jgi:L-lactate dehydrogenase complex protein LldE